MEPCTPASTSSVTGTSASQLRAEADPSTTDTCASDSSKPPTEFHLFMDLPNELIMKLMTYFGSSENLILSRLNSRLYSLCTSNLSQGIWKRIVINNTIDKHDTFCYLSNFVADDTTSISVRSRINGSNRGFTSSLPPRLLASLKTMPVLVKLKLIGQRFDEKVPNIFTLLPPTLTSLDLSQTFINVVMYENVPNDEQPISIEASFSYFGEIAQYLPQLENLKLNSCVWLLPFDLVHIRRLMRLRKLSINGCKLSNHLARSSGRGVHYVEPIAIRRLQWRRVFSVLQGGFCNLEVLDITNTDINRNGMLSALIPRYTEYRETDNPLPIPTQPIRVLKLGYYDSDYVWSLMGDTINISLLERAGNLEILDVSGFYLETSAPGVRRTRMCSVEEIERTLQSCAPNLKEVCVHFCKLMEPPGVSTRRRTPSDGGDDHAVVESVPVKKAFASNTNTTVYYLS